MKTKELTNIGAEELNKLLVEKERAFFELEFKHSGDQKQRAKRRLIKRDIARILTIQSERFEKGTPQH